MAAELVAHADFDVSADVVFDRLCAVETWPVWLSFVNRAERRDAGGPLQRGIDLLLSSELTGFSEEIFEVDELYRPNLLTFVGAYSCRRRIQFHVERRESGSRLTMRIGYRVHGGFAKRIMNHVGLRRRIARALNRSLETFRGLVEHDAETRADAKEYALV